METIVDEAVKKIVGMIKDDTNADNVLKYSQSALNLANCKAVLASSDHKNKET